MIIIDNIIENAKIFMKTGSILSIINILCIFACIGILIWYIRYYSAKDIIVIEDTYLLDLMHNPICRMSIYTSSIYANINVPTTKNASHWFIVVTVIDDNNKCHDVVLTSSRKNSIYAMDADRYLPTLCQVKFMKAYNTRANIVVTLGEVMQYMYTLLKSTTYSTLQQNCHHFVYYVINRYCETTNDKFNKPFEGTTLLQAVISDML